MDPSPDRLQELRDQTRKGLQFLISYLLSNAEQALLGMAGKSRSNVEQAQHYEAMRELRLKGRSLEQAFLARALQGFDTIGQSVPPPPPRASTKVPPSAEMNIAGLGVVKDTLLEEQLAIENIASRARHEHRDVLVLLAQHIARESGQRRVELDALPIGPQALAHAFMTVLAELEVDPQARVVFSKLFTRFIIDELGPFYAQCVKLFPDEEQLSREAAAVAAVNAEATAPAELPTGQRSDDELQAVGGPAQKLDTAWDNARTPLLAPPGKAMAMPRNLVDEVLESLQARLLDSRKPLPALNPKAGIQPLEVMELLNDTLAEMGYTRAMALPTDVVEAVSLVRLLFEHALRDPQVASPMRRLVRLLQIPLLRAALREPEVLSGATHPARLLFKELGAAAIGWTPPAEGGDDDFLRLVKLLVTRILNDYEKDAVVFRAGLEDLRRYVRAREGSTRLEESRTLISGTGKAEAQAARGAIADLVASAATGASLPAPVTEFLRGTWSDALFVIRLRDGENSDEWGLAVETTGRLVAATRADHLPGAFTAVAQGIRRALLRLGLDEDTANRRIGVLEATVSGTPEAGGELAAEASVKPAAARPPAAPEFLQLVDKLAPDTWIEFREAGGARRRAKILTKIPRTGLFMFVDRDGGKAGEWNRSDLASMIEQGEAMVLNGPAGNAPSAPGRFGRR